MKESVPTLLFSLVVCLAACRAANAENGAEAGTTEAAYPKAGPKPVAKIDPSDDGSWNPNATCTCIDVNTFVTNFNSDRVICTASRVRLTKPPTQAKPYEVWMTWTKNAVRVIPRLRGEYRLKRHIDDRVVDVMDEIIERIPPGEPIDMMRQIYDRIDVTLEAGLGEYKDLLQVASALAEQLPEVQKSVEAFPPDEELRKHVAQDLQTDDQQTWTAKDLELVHLQEELTFLIGAWGERIKRGDDLVRRVQDNPDPIYIRSLSTKYREIFQAPVPPKTAIPTAAKVPK